MAPFLNEASAKGHETPSSKTEKLFPHIHSDPAVAPSSLDPFTITTSTGFMPLKTPIVELPAVWKPLSDIAEQMPIVKEDGTPGLLATYEFGPTIDKGVLPDFTAEIDNLVCADGKPNLELVTAVFRDYSFLASSYLLEPCWERWNKGLEGYGLGRDVLPRCLAGPLYKTAKLLDIPPFMAYAAAYSLYNYRFANPSIGASQYENLRLIRAFERGLDPLSSEAGFILTHVDMVQHSGGLIKGAVGVLDGVASKTTEEVVDAFHSLLSTMKIIEESMEAMWSHSRPKDYISYRTFIFGITNQSMFPNGVVYEGENDGKPMDFRGESGANDAIIPLLDYLLQIPMPVNPLTEILKDFRNYRPKPHRDFLTHVREESEALNTREFCLKDLETRVLYLKLLDHVRSFRWRHWLFAREYIIRQTSHPTATGGSPIVTWLPNQLIAVMDLMCEVWEGVAKEDHAALGKTVEMMANVQDQREKLHIEVQRWCQERGV
ncbi:Hypothetical protein R9X50_00594600 [Acrodontium crateriforme]|uniref:Indoleamine 2,3-dioxygenase n=1 Tax=Acrodontium crateriforme TaxID=150365 RepID=A0AAQ3M752_9PEZI|nr:Hypothetical protein R9X50_00594600 [Acrodontium crateriforme]